MSPTRTPPSTEEEGAEREPTKRRLPLTLLMLQLKLLLLLHRLTLLPLQLATLHPLLRRNFVFFCCQEPC